MTLGLTELLCLVGEAQNLQVEIKKKKKRETPVRHRKWAVVWPQSPNPGVLPPVEQLPCHEKFGPPEKLVRGAEISGI